MKLSPRQQHVLEIVRTRGIVPCGTLAHSASCLSNRGLIVFVKYHDRVGPEYKLPDANPLSMTQTVNLLEPK